jgi:hypothetical protein
MANESYLLKQIRAANAAIDELLAGAKSASVSTLGGSRSYTRESLTSLEAYRDNLVRKYNMAGMRKRTAPNFGTPLSEVP